MDLVQTREGRLKSKLVSRCAFKVLDSIISMTRETKIDIDKLYDLLENDERGWFEMPDGKGDFEYIPNYPFLSDQLNVSEGSIQYQLDIEERKKYAEYGQRPEVKERNNKKQRERYKIPEVKQKIIEYQKEYRKRPEVKKRAKLNKQKPEVKKRRSEWNKKYNQIPEVKKRKNMQHKMNNFKRYVDCKRGLKALGNLVEQYPDIFNF